MISINYELLFITILLGIMLKYFTSKEKKIILHEKNITNNINE